MSDAPRKDPPVPSTALAPAAAPATSPSPSSPAVKDIVILGPPTADGGGVHILRAREERIETGELRAMEEGRPIVGEVVTLKPRDANPRVCDVTSSFNPGGLAPSPRSPQKGPAKVSTRAYREGWDEIFGTKRPPPGPAN